MVAGTGADPEQETASGESRVRDVVRRVVAEVAPEELAVVDGLSEFDDDTAVRRLRRQGRRREPLGFGLGEVVVLVTAVVWLVVDEAANRAAGVAVDGSAATLRRGLRRIFRRRTAVPVVVPPLTRGQLADVHRKALEAATAAGLSEQRARAIADSTVANLALNPTREGEQSPPDGPVGA